MVLRHFQPGEGSIRDLVCDCETSNFARIHFQLYFSSILQQRKHFSCLYEGLYGAELRGETQLTSPLCPDCPSSGCRYLHPARSCNGAIIIVLISLIGMLAAAKCLLVCWFVPRRYLCRGAWFILNQKWFFKTFLCTTWTCIFVHKKVDP